MIFKVLIFSLGVTLISVLVKEQFRPFSIALSVAGCIGIYAIALTIVKHMGYITELTELGGSGLKQSISVAAKSMGVMYLTNFGADICTDAGEKAIASALETTGKIIILSMALPLLSGIFASVVSLIGT